ncbi:MAG: hypothetical protein AB3N22_09370 [Ruegeria sp.]
MAEPPIFIHAGAHRTGTSSFQMCLHENRQMLEQSNWALAYPGRDGIPSGNLALRLPSGNTGDVAQAQEKVARALASHSAGKPLILSEENIPGRMFHFMRGTFYPFAELRCETLRAAWPGSVAHVLLVVRPYDELYVSAFRKRAEDNAMPDFDQVRDGYLSMDRGWPELVTLMQDILKPDTITVIPYLHRGTSAQLLGRLVPGLPGNAMVEPKRIVNKSASDAALDALQLRYRAGEKLTREAWTAVIDAHRGNTTPTGFAAFSDEESAELSARYASDLKQIEWMPSVSFG